MLTQTTSTTDLLNFQNLLNGFLPKEAKIVSNFIALPNESTTARVVRKTFEDLGWTLMLFNKICFLPTLSFSMKVCDICRPPEHYQIGDTNTPTTEAAILRDLIALSINRFKFKSITITHASNQRALNLSNTIAAPLKKLKPTIIRLINATLADSFKKALETPDHYYLPTTVTTPTTRQELCLKAKIKKLILSAEPLEVIQQLQSLITRNQKVSALYFTAIIPESYEHQIGELVHQLQPDVQALIMNEEELTSDQLLLSL